MTTHSETSAARKSAFQAPPLTDELKKTIHDKMVATRVTAEVTIKMNRAGQGFFWIGGPGEEAFGVCLGLLVKKGQGPDYDYLHMHYRGDPTAFAMGCEPIDTLRQMRGAQTDPYSGGRNFVNHYAVKKWNIVPVTPTIETQYIVSTGTAWVQKRHGGDGISIVTGGDAGTAEGDFYIALNWSSVPQRELPLLITITHNNYGISTQSSTMQNSPNLAQRAEPFGIPWAVADGNDVLEIWQALAEAMHYCRTERKAFCLQANVSRLHGHSSASGGNRVTDEVDCIEKFEAHLIEQGLMTRAECDAVWERWREQLAADLKQVLDEPLASDRDAFIFAPSEEN